MNVDTGRVYTHPDDVLEAERRGERLVVVEGPEAHVRVLSRAVAERRRRARKTARASRRANRR